MVARRCLAFRAGTEPRPLFDSKRRNMRLNRKRRRGDGFFCLAVSFLAPQAWAQSPESQHEAVYRKTASSVVGIRAFATFGDHNGTGVILTPDGLIATSSAVVPAGSENIRVWLHGARQRKARFVEAWPDLELSLIKVEEKDLVPLPLGDSSALRPGDAVYSIGNVFDSIFNDDQPALNLGVVSGLYTSR